MPKYYTLLPSCRASPVGRASQEIINAYKPFQVLDNCRLEFSLLAIFQHTINAREFGAVISSKKGLLAVGLSVVILGSILGKLAIDNRLPWQIAGASSDSAEPENTGQAPEGGKVDAKAVKTQQRSKITLQEALQIAETTIDGKAYGVEREIEEGKAVIEVEISGKEVFVDAESGEIVAMDDLYETGDREDLEEVNEALQLQPLAKTTIQEALEAAESFAGDQAHTVELENEDGNLVYEVGIGLQEIYVDAGNGQVLYTETVGKGDEIDDSQAKSSIQIPLTDDSDEP